MQPYLYIELIFGAIIIWIGFYLLSRNVFSTLYWIIFLFFFGFGFLMISDIILRATPDLRAYIEWQKISDWTLFFAPIFYFHTSALATNDKSKTSKVLLYAGYAFALLFTIIDIKGGLILKENVIRFEDFRNTSGFAPGILLIPSMTIILSYQIFGMINFFSKIKESLAKYFLPFLSGLLILISGILIMISFYYPIQMDILTVLGPVVGVALFAYSMVRYHLFSPTEKRIFDLSFYYKTALITLFTAFYLLILPLAGIKLDFSGIILISFLIMMIMFTHSIYDWFGTFINDLQFNISSGFSIVSDQEINHALKNYSNPANLEDSHLLRLKIINKRIRNSELPVDATKQVLKEAIEYFKPTDEPHRRIKSNLKYHLIKMITDEAEEGQILWDLGFEEYPTKILANEGNSREPLFKIKSSSDYSSISRNAFIALKKEAIHQIAWRVSYLEKNSKKG